MTLKDFGLASCSQIKTLTVYTIVSVALQIKCLPVQTVSSSSIQILTDAVSCEFYIQFHHTAW